MNRTEFRINVLKRDNYKCIKCGHSQNLDAHHIIERRLFSDGGYYLDNGATLCSEHHILAEQTKLTCDEIRQILGITNIILPDHLYPDNIYDKWGNIILPNGTRLRGELFYDPSVQKILKEGNVLHEFTKYVKYPRTYHLPYSNLSKNDRILDSDDNFKNKQVVVTLKMDGENTTMYNDYIHARSISESSHPSRTWIKNLWSTISYLLDDNMRICGENLYAVHTIKYNNLISYFMAFSIWINDKCLSWNESIEYFKLLNIYHVPIIYNDIYNADRIKLEFEKYKNTNEGYVVRIADEFSYGEFKKSVAKYVKPEFKPLVNNSHCHWLFKKMETNSLNL